MEQKKLTLLTKILCSFFMCSSRDKIKRTLVELIGVLHDIGVLSINKNVNDISIFLSHTELQLIILTGNSAALLLRKF